MCVRRTTDREAEHYMTHNRPSGECVVCKGTRAYLSKDHRPLCSSLECYRALHPPQKTM
jgi:hypothetical protein